MPKTDDDKVGDEELWNDSTDSENDLKEFKVNFGTLQPPKTTEPKARPKKSPFPAHFKPFILKEKTNFYLQRFMKVI